jgi:NAD(P)-dependent dehydrogenase (short-subunit alcohol dehydrogenase family)
MKTNSSSNRVALVTGGSRGIGAAIVRRLIQEEVAVAFTYSSAQEKALALVAEIEGRGGRALAIQADSANATEVRDAVSKTVEAFGRLNILVNNAGILLRGTIDTFSHRTPAQSKVSYRSSGWGTPMMSPRWSLSLPVRRQTSLREPL